MKRNLKRGWGIEVEDHSIDIYIYRERERYIDRYIHINTYTCV